MSGTEISLEKLLSASANPEQSESILGMMNQAVEFMKKADSIVSTLQKWGVSPELVERIAIKFGKLEDVKPLPKNSNGITARTPLHAAIFEQLNNLDEKQLEEQVKAQQAKQEKNETKKPR